MASCSKILIATLALVLSACNIGGNIEAPAQSTQQPVCSPAASPEANVDTSQCSRETEIRLVVECDRPLSADPFPAIISNADCIGVSHDGGRVWCCER